MGLFFVGLFMLFIEDHLSKARSRKRAREFYRRYGKTQHTVVLIVMRFARAPRYMGWVIEENSSFSA
jgi:hypothetical protein